jgi:hypothetical protein
MVTVRESATVRLVSCLILDHQKVSSQNSWIGDAGADSSARKCGGYGVGSAPHLAARTPGRLRRSL